MSTTSATITLGVDESGHFLDFGWSRTYFSDEMLEALKFAQVFSGSIAAVFYNFCSVTLDSGDLPSCLHDQLNAEDVEDFRKGLATFKDHFANAIFELALVFEH
jgi:hypothetical protein